MKFIIKRASDLCGSNIPCENAKIESENYFGEKCCSIDIDSIDNLLSFVEREGDIVISESRESQRPISKWKIIIYDDYLE